jgi:hypothetical protein
MISSILEIKVILKIKYHGWKPIKVEINKVA